MSSRDQILETIRQQQVPPVELPDLGRETFLAFADPVQQFRSLLDQVGGTSHEINSLSQIPDHLNIDLEDQSSRIVSLVEGVPGNLSLDGIDDPTELNLLDLAILPGQFGVAENGAVWVHDQGVAQRAIWFITEHLVLVVRQQDVLQNMHAAYDRLASDRNGFGDPPFGCFISGPSKTADIEQSLVIGAQGSRRHTVFLLAGQ